MVRAPGAELGVGDSVIGVQDVIRWQAWIRIFVGVIANAGKPQTVLHAGDLRGNERICVFSLGNSRRL